jgi:HK97 family phage prohead protease
MPDTVLPVDGQEAPDEIVAETPDPPPELRADQFPRENLVRLGEPVGIRSDDGGDGRLATIFGRMVAYNQWAEVNSRIEGHFLERVAPGAFARTFNANRSRLQLIYDHGQDQIIGRKPLGPLESIADAAEGVDYAGALMDTSYNRDLLPGLRAGVYGSSYRFNTVRDQWTMKPAKSEYNPDRLP